MGAMLLVVVVAVVVVDAAVVEGGAPVVLDCDVIEVVDEVELLDGQVHTPDSSQGQTPIGTFLHALAQSSSATRFCTLPAARHGIGDGASVVGGA